MDSATTYGLDYSSDILDYIEITMKWFIYLHMRRTFSESHALRFYMSRFYIRNLICDISTFYWTMTSYKMITPGFIHLFGNKIVQQVYTNLNLEIVNLSVFSVKYSFHGHDHSD